MATTNGSSGTTTQPTMKLPRLRKDQFLIATDEAKVKVCAMARRWGKTTLGGCMALITASQGYPVAWVAPEFKNTRPLWRFCRRAVAPLKASGFCRVSEADKTIEFQNGGIISLFSADNPDSILGDAFKLVIVDESARIAQEIITEIILPTLADYDGDLLLISTPRGLNYFFEWFQRGQNHETGFASFTAPSTDNPSPAIRRAYERAKQITPELKFAQEWDAQFIPDGSGAFSNIDACATAEPQTKAIEGHRYTQGIDWGRKDFTVIATYDCDLNAIVDIVRINELDSIRQRQYVVDAYNRFKSDVILAERNSIGAPLIDELAALGLPVQAFNTTSASKNMLVDQLSLALMNGTIKLIPHAVLLNEMKAYSGRQLPSGLFQYGSPAYHDDTCIAVMLALHAARDYIVYWEPFLL